VQRLLGLEPVQGGNWYTGYHQHGGEWYLFPGVGAGGRTGHDDGNRWHGDRLVWFGRTGSRLSHESVRSMLADGARVHLFTRAQDRDPFTYEGLVRPAEVHDEVPVRIHWELAGPGPAGARLPQEVEGAAGARYPEGALRRLTVNAYERNPAARRACLEHWGTRCAACGVDLGERYGPIAAGFIHVHHLRPLAELGEGYEVDPVADLRPLCPNCHGVVHLRTPPLTIEELRALLARQHG